MEVKPLGHVIEGEESEEEEEVVDSTSSDGELSEEIRVKTAAAAAAAASGLVCEGEDDEEDEEYLEDGVDNATKPALADAQEQGAGEVQMIEHQDEEERRASMDVPAASDEAASSSAPGGKASYASLGAFSEAIVPLLKPRRKNTLVQEQSAAERKVTRHNQGIRTTISAKMHHTYQSTHKDVVQVSHQLDLVRNVTQDLNIKVRSINDDLEKLTAIVDKTCGSFLQLLQPSLRTMHT